MNVLSCLICHQGVDRVYIYPSCGWQWRHLDAEQQSTSSSREKDGKSFKWQEVELARDGVGWMWGCGCKEERRREGDAGSWQLVASWRCCRLSYRVCCYLSPSFLIRKLRAVVKCWMSASASLTGCMCRLLWLIVIWSFVLEQVLLALEQTLPKHWLYVWFLFVNNLYFTRDSFKTYLKHIKNISNIVFLCTVFKFNFLRKYVFKQTCYCALFCYIVILGVYSNISKHAYIHEYII